jgi:hypothetical protein
LKVSGETKLASKERRISLLSRLPRAKLIAQWPFFSFRVFSKDKHFSDTENYKFAQNSDEMN